VAKAKEKAKDKDVLGRLADRGEEALQRIAELPGGTKALKAFNELRERVDELSKKVRGIDKLEERIEQLEKDLAALKRPPKPAAAPRASTPAAKKPPV
jgi:phage shock protein A